MAIVILATLLFAAVAMNVVRHFGTSRLVVSVGLIALAGLLYLLSYALHMFFIRRRAPHLLRTSEGLIHTSATQFVPRWVKEIFGLVIAALLAAVLPWLVALIRVFLPALIPGFR